MLVTGLAIDGTAQAKRIGLESIPQDQAFGLSMTADKKTAYFVRSYSGRDTLVIHEMRNVNGKWETPRPIRLGSASWPSVKDIDPFVTPDGRELYFQSNRLTSDSDQKNDFNLWMARRSDEGGWLGPEYMGDLVNSESSESYASKTAGAVVYFGSDQPGTLGNFDIFRSEFRDGAWQKGKSLGMSINSIGRDANPFISHDESFLIYNSSRGTGYGDADLYISFNQGSSWTTPWNLGPEINSEIVEFCPFMLPGDNTLYFARLRRDGTRFRENLFEASLQIEKLKQLAGITPTRYQNNQSIIKGLSYITPGESGQRFLVACDDNLTLSELYQVYGSAAQRIPIDHQGLIKGMAAYQGALYVSIEQNNNTDIYHLDLKTSTLSGLAGPVNTASNEIIGSIAANGTLYFSRQGSDGSEDIYTSAITSSGFAEPIKISQLNSSARESTPGVAPDESYIIFSSDRPDSFGELDLYISFKNDGGWSSAQNLGPSINSEVNEWHAAISGKEKKVFFTRTPIKDGKRYGDEIVQEVNLRSLATINAKFYDHGALK
ncbi:MAG TPA: hypothetical protein VGD40_23120 [Chryseosolibacter sp.]